MYKKLKNKKIKLIFGLILLITLNFAFTPSFLTPMKKDNSDVLELKSSGVFYDIEIDDLPGSLTNWSWAETQPWFGGGSGTSGDPYIIEDHTFEFSAGSGNSFSILNSRKYFIINNCTFKNSGGSSNGLYLFNTTNGQITNNQMTNNYRGLYLDLCNDTSISDNLVYSNNFYGIYLVNSHFNTISENNASLNSNRGIRLYQSTFNIILENTVYDNVAWDGIQLYNNSNNNTVSGNIVSNSGDNGIEIVGTSLSNTITGNTILNHSGEGIYIYSGCNYNLLYENVLKNNGLHAYDDGSNNDWNNTAIGNYWDDYTGYDMDLDGIGDDPYSVAGSAGNFDYLPIWNLQSPIAIDDLPSSLTNWSWAETQPWFGGGSGTGLDPYIIEDLIIDGNGTDNCLTVLNSDKYFIIQNCKVYNSGTVAFASGILLSNVTNSQLIGNNASNNEFYGISILDSNYNTISGNTANHNTVYGIYLDDSYFNILSENTASNNPTSNFFLLNSENNTLYRNFANEISMYGIYLLGSDFNDIIECEVYNSTTRGIHLNNSNNNTISDNTAMYNFWGLFAIFSNDNTFSKNIFNNNTELGMAVENSYGNKIIENTANFNKNTWGGIMVSISVNTLVQDNIVIGNNPRGIGIIFGSDNNNATGNIIKENTIGFEIEPGSDNNLMYENIFLRNGIHATDDGSNNDWNSTTIGNYWDNHTGPDISPNDGIVDNPYPYIGGSVGSIDHLPIAEEGPPSIIINSPSENDVFGTSAPSFSVTITDTFLDEMWYTLDGGLHNYTFTGSTGTIDQLAWNVMLDGMITLIFYASDTPGNIGSAEVNIEKDTHGPLIVISSPLTDDTFVANAPSFLAEISDDHLDSMWYSLDGGITNFIFTANGTINQAAWSDLLVGPVTITFYANDTLGNLSSESVNVVKNLPPPDDNFVVIIIIIVSIVAGVAIVTVVLLLRRRKAGTEA